MMETFRFNVTRHFQFLLPDVKIKGDNVRLLGTKDLTLLGKVYGEFIGGVVNSVGLATLVVVLHLLVN